MIWSVYTGSQLIGIVNEHTEDRAHNAAVDRYGRAWSDGHEKWGTRKVRVEPGVTQRGLRRRVA